MYSLGLWYGNKLVADSMDDALKKYPPPDGLTDASSISWSMHNEFAAPYCGFYKSSSIISGSDSYSQCMCKLEYPAGYESPNCGCGYREVSSVGSLLGASSDVCMSGGTVVMVFFSVLFGGFALGQAGPAFEALAKATHCRRQNLQNHRSRARKRYRYEKSNWEGTFVSYQR